MFVKNVNGLEAIIKIAISVVSAWWGHSIDKGCMSDLWYLPLKPMQHEPSAKHLNNVIDLSALSRVNIAAEIDSTY